MTVRLVEMCLGVKKINICEKFWPNSCKSIESSYKLKYELQEVSYKN